MNGTELKTLRQSLFLSVAEAATLHQVQERVYRHWEAGEWVIPDDVAARMEKLDDMANYVAFNERARCENAADRGDIPALIRYASDADIWALEGLTAALPCSIHAAGIDRARQDLKHTRAAARIVTMDREAYEGWLGDHEWHDSAANRQLWAATVIDPPPRAKKIKQASSEQKSKQASGEGASHGQ